MYVKYNEIFVAMLTVNSNYKDIINSIPDDVKVIPITKNKTIDEILGLYNCGHRVFGESKVQELLPKYEQLPKDIQWQMVGHLQKNKVKYVAPFITMIQSVDSFKLLDVINNEAQKNERVIECLLQIHIAEEETKFGLSFEEVNQILESKEFGEMENVALCGIMGMATFTENEEQIRKEFKTLKSFFDQAKSKYFNQNDNFSQLSMGMSNDYQIAVEEGSTILRIGTALFGER